MSLLRNIERLLVVILLSAGAATGQNGVVTVTSFSGNVLVHGTMQLSASVADLSGTPLDGSGISWTSSDTSIASIAADGTLTGNFPGDVTITATDSITGASSSLAIHVVPLAINITTPLQQFHAGDTVQLAAAATDATGKTIPGIAFEFRSGEPAIASIGSNGAITGIAEGFTTIEARIPSVSGNPALAATTPVHVLPQAAYQIRKLLSTDVTANTTVAAVSMLSASNSQEIAAIVTLANGNQAAVLIEGGKTKVLAVGGQVLPNAQRMVLRLDAISANARGDVAMLIEYPTQFCTASVFLFPHGQPEQEIATANCNNGLYPRSLGEDGSVLYRSSDQIYSASANSTPKLLFSIATQPAAKDPIRSVSDFYPSRTGTFALNTSLTSGVHVYFVFDGKQLNKVYQDGDPLKLTTSNSIDNIIGSPDGTFYARINGPNFSALTMLTTGPLQTLVYPGDPVGSGTGGYVQSIADANASGVLMVCDVTTNAFHRSICVWDTKKLVEYTPADGYGAMVAGALMPDGTALVYASIFDATTIAGLRSFTSDGKQTMVLAAGTPFPQPVPAGIDWHYASRGGSANSLAVRAAADAIVNIGNSVQTVASLGWAFERGKPITWIGGAIGNESGDLVFSVGYALGNALLRYRGGKLDTMLDSGVQGTGPSGTNLSWLRSDRGRWIAMNNRGDIALIAPFNSTWSVVLYNADKTPHLIVQQGGAAPGGSTFTNNFPSVAIDDNGHVMFTSITADGLIKVFYWDGNTVQRVIGIGDAGPNGYTLNEVSNIAGSGSGFAMILAFGNYVTRELRSFDGITMKVIESTDTALLDGTGLNSFWANECTVSANGDVHYLAATQDGGSGVYAHRGEREVIVARSRDQLPGGEWLLMPLSVSSSMNGEVYFTADVWLNGVESLALYEATRQ